MLHDAGIAVFYRVELDEISPPPKKARLVRKSSQSYGEKTVGVTRFYAAAKVGMRADRLIEIWRDDSITTRDICRLGNRYFLIQQVAQGEDEDGLLVTSLTLEESDGNVWEADNHENHP